MAGKKHLVWHVAGKVIESEVDSKFLHSMKKRPAAAPLKKPAAAPTAEAEEEDEDKEEDEEEEEEEEYQNEEDEQEGQTDDGEEQEDDGDDFQEEGEEEAQAEEDEGENEREDEGEDEGEHEGENEGEEEEEDHEEEQENPKCPPKQAKSEDGAGNEKEGVRMRVSKKRPVEEEVEEPDVECSYKVNAYSGKSVRTYLLVRTAGVKKQLVQVSPNECSNHQDMVSRLQEEADTKISEGIKFGALRAWAASRKAAMLAAEGASVIWKPINSNTTEVILFTPPLSHPCTKLQNTYGVTNQGEGDWQTSMKGGDLD